MRNVFDRELEILHQDMQKMGFMVMEAIDNAVIALKNQDTELAKAVMEADREVDAMEKAIETRALKLLLSQQPVARDLRVISTTLKVITDMERIGDQASDIAEISMRFEGQQFIKELIHIPKMAEIAIEMVKMSIDSYIHLDCDEAEAVIDRDDEVDNLFQTVKTDLVEMIVKRKDDVADQAIDFIMIAKYLERIADHATNIGEWTIFKSTGCHRTEKG